MVRHDGGQAAPHHQHGRLVLAGCGLEKVAVLARITEHRAQRAEYVIRIIVRRLQDLGSQILESARQQIVFVW